MMASLMLLVSQPAAAAQPTGSEAPLPPSISFPHGDSTTEGGHIAVRFDANGDTAVTGFRYSVDGTYLDTMVSAAPDGTATVTIDVGSWGGERPVYAVAIDQHDRRSRMTQATFTVSVIWNLKGRVIDINSWLPAEGATIRLEPAGTEVVVGPDGYFQFAVDPGLYTVIGTHAGPPSLYGSQQLLLDDHGVWLELLLFPEFE